LIAAIKARLGDVQMRMESRSKTIQRLANKPQLGDQETRQWNNLTTAQDSDQRVRATLKDALAAVEAGDVTLESGTSQGNHSPEFMRRASLDEAWHATGPMNSPDELRSRALTIIEDGDGHDTIRRMRGGRDDLSDESRAALADLVRTSGSEFSEQVIALSRPAYAEVFEAYLRGEESSMTPEQAHALRDVRALTRDEARATLLESGTGAFAVPTMLDNTINVQNVGSVNALRSIASNAKINTQTWHGISTAGITAEITSEAVEVADATPTLGTLACTPVRCDAYAELSMEMIQDSDVAGQLSALFRDAADQLEATNMVSGTTAGLTGVVTTVGATTASRVTSAQTATFIVADVFNVDNGLPARYRPNASWLAHWATFNAARQFTVGASPSAGSFWSDLNDGRPPRLVGHPTYEASAMTSSVSTSTAQCLLVGDFKQGFKIVDRITSFVLRNDWIVGASNRPKGVTGFAYFWRVGCVVTNADSFRLLKLR
jgi:HK97 family phage major capsid protein